MSKRKFLAMTTATIVAFAMMFSSVGTTTVNAEELEAGAVLCNRVWRRRIRRI